MPNYSSHGRTDSKPSYYPTSTILYGPDHMTGREHREPEARARRESPSQVPHSSFLIDDILGKKEREQEGRRDDIRLKESHRERRRSHSGERESACSGRNVEYERDAVTDRHTELQRSEMIRRHSRDIFDNERLRDSDVRSREPRDIERRSRYVESHRSSDPSVERHPFHRVHQTSPISNHSLPSPTSTATATSGGLLSPEIPRPTPINPAAIQTSALTTPTIFKPLPTLYDPSVLSPAGYLNPHLSVCQTSLVRQMAGLTQLPPYARHDYPAFFDNQYPFSKSKS